MLARETVTRWACGWGLGAPPAIDWWRSARRPCRHIVRRRTGGLLVLEGAHQRLCSALRSGHGTTQAGRTQSICQTLEAPGLSRREARQAQAQAAGRGPCALLHTPLARFRLGFRPTPRADYHANHAANARPQVTRPPSTPAAAPKPAALPSVSSSTLHSPFRSSAFFVPRPWVDARAHLLHTRHTEVRHNSRLLHSVSAPLTRAALPLVRRPSFPSLTRQHLF